MAYQCSTCGEIHEDLPDIGDDKPYHWYTIPEKERDQRSTLTEDTCVIDDRDFFIRGVIYIPVHGQEEDFGFGVWVSQKKENFQTYLENYDTDQIGPFFGWLSSELTYYGESTLNLKTTAHFLGNGQRPMIVLHKCDHPLAIDQQDGISLDKAWKIVHFYMGERIAQ